MRILHLTPGTGSFYCGSCLRDNALVKALRARGHDAQMAPLYLPLVTDFEEVNPEQPVRVGGIGLYIQEKFPWFRFAPSWVKKFINSERNLRWAGSKIGMTSAKDLGVMTVGSLQGEAGRQWPEWQSLIDWVLADMKPDVICLSNALLMGLAPTLAKAGIPVICSLQGEDAFLDTLIEPYRTQAWKLMVQNAKSVTRFVSPSKFYADTMAPRLGATEEQMSVVYNGIQSDAYLTDRQEPEIPTIGYLARMIHGKGLTTLIKAFIELTKRSSVPNVRLRVAGTKTAEDDPYLEGLRKQLSEAGVLDRVTFEANLTFEEKRKFLSELTIFSVPATYGEAFGLYIIEAQCSGVPVVQPKHGAFPELVAATQGGVLCEPDDPVSLAAGLEELLLHPERRRQLSEAGKINAIALFSAPKMAEAFEELLENLKLAAVGAV